MNYRELQQTLKNLRNAGHVATNFKLNQKKEILQAEFDRIKAIAFSKTIPTPQPQPSPQPQPAPKADFKKLIKAHDNYIPAYELAKALQLNPPSFWKWAYSQAKAGKIELSTLQEGFHYTPEQLAYEAPGYANWFYVSFN